MVCGSLRSCEKRMNCYCNNQWLQSGFHGLLHEASHNIDAHSKGWGKVIEEQVDTTNISIFLLFSTRSMSSFFVLTSNLAVYMNEISVFTVIVSGKSTMYILVLSKFEHRIFFVRFFFVTAQQSILCVLIVLRCTYTNRSSKCLNLE